MEYLRRAAALLARIGYTLSRYKFLLLPIDKWMLAFLLACSLYLGWNIWKGSFHWQQALGILACCLILSMLLFVRAKRYTLFQKQPFPPSEESLLHPNEKIWLHSTGYFEVSGMRRYFVEVPSVLWVTELDDYILMARVKVVNIPLLSAPTNERGLWYIFNRSQDIAHVATGYLYFGLSRRPAIQIRYREPSGIESTAYLSLDTLQQHSKLAYDLKMRAQLKGRGTQGSSHHDRQQDM